ncbi:hypothetical protein FVEG_02530 [Fusarium verticillioides 7600]|uniref:Uncharacterized protein n=1 Tax=Gibberella moniliformis (strain M3125 / FGSC 7600) TaxID=334819 RepID=W7LWM6_GIBM7|nr:hypothetical protein FVEG_02530 [Fusarium verticillioides 7600]EWG39875.1 hypothetical protein FVEG_02530 [Fusarium verticillioides 7600]
MQCWSVLFDKVKVNSAQPANRKLIGKTKGGFGRTWSGREEPFLYTAQAIAVPVLTKSVPRYAFYKVLEARPTVFVDDACCNLTRATC